MIYIVFVILLLYFASVGVKATYNNILNKGKKNINTMLEKNRNRKY